MEALLRHPWLMQPVLGDWLNRTVQASMQSAAVALDSENPPRWIVTLAETGRDYEAYTEISVAESATISILGDAHDGPLQCALTPVQTSVLLNVLDECSKSNVDDVENLVLDGLLCSVAVVDCLGNWCAFSEFNVAGLDQADLTLSGPRIATLIQSFHRDLRTLPSAL